VAVVAAVVVPVWASAPVSPPSPSPAPSPVLSPPPPPSSSVSVVFVVSVSFGCSGKFGSTSKSIPSSTSGVVTWSLISIGSSSCTLADTAASVSSSAVSADSVAVNSVSYPSSPASDTTSE